MVGNLEEHAFGQEEDALAEVVYQRLFRHDCVGGVGLMEMYAGWLFVVLAGQSVWY